MFTGHVSKMILYHAKEAARLIAKRDHAAEREWDWLVGELTRMASTTNYRFFQRIAARADSQTFLRWCLCAMQDHSSLELVLHEAEKVYGYGVPPFQPKLLEIVRKWSNSVQKP